MIAVIVFLVLAFALLIWMLFIGRPPERGRMSEDWLRKHGHDDVVTRGKEPPDERRDEHRTKPEQ